MVLYIKNMVCDRCITTVNYELIELGFTQAKTQLGEVFFNNAPTNQELEKIDEKLRLRGFELLRDRKKQIIEKIKNVLLYIARTSKDDIKVNYSTLIESELQLDYTYLSNLFSEVESITIEKYLILQKIERIKELLVYNELSLSQIADSMGYSSVAYLSAQFKKITGLTTSHYKKVKDKKRIALDKIQPVNVIKSINNSVMIE